MFVLARQAALFIKPDKSESFSISNGFMGTVPEWIAETKQFKRMVAAGLIVASESTKDKDIQVAVETKETEKPRRKSKSEE